MGRPFSPGSDGAASEARSARSLCSLPPFRYDDPSMSARSIRIVGAVALSLATLLVATVAFFFWRDNLATHFPIRALIGERLRSFELPLWNHWVGGGQPLAGNPNTLAFYPDFPLALVFPPIVAFNLHFLLHWILGGWSAAFFLRTFDLDRKLVALGTLLWLFCGTVVSLFAFYNLITAVALVPLSLAAAERLLRSPGWRPAILLGVAFGLLALAGEPVTILATALVALILGVGRIRGRGMAWVGLAMMISILIASPLLLAWSEVAGEVERGARTYSAETVLAASLSPWQLAEIAVGPLRGLATDFGPRGYFRSGATEKWQPLLLSVFLSALAFPALLVTTPPFRRIQIATFVLLVLALGRHNPLVAEIVERMPALRFGRYPEKLAIPATLLLIVLIAGWLSRQRRAADRVVAIAGILLAMAFAVAAIAGVFGVHPPMQSRIVIGSIVAAIVLLLAVVVPEANKFAVLAAATLAPLLITAILVVPIDWAAPYRGESHLAGPLVSKRIVRLVHPATQDAGFANARQQHRVAATALDPVFGVRSGIGYAMDRSPEGMFSLLSRVLQERFTSADDDVKARLARLVGVSAFVHDGAITAGALEPVASARLSGRTVHLYAVKDPLPPVLAAPTVESVPSIGEAVRRLEDPQFDPARRSLGPPGFDREGAIAVRSFQRIPDGWRIETETPAAAALLVNESYFGAWRAEDQQGRELGIFPMNLDRLGVAVPAGTTEVTVRFGRRREWIASAWVLSSILLAASLFALIQSRGARS